MFLVGFTDNSPAKPPGPARLDAKDPKNLTPGYFKLLHRNKQRKTDSGSTDRDAPDSGSPMLIATALPARMDDNVGRTPTS